MGWTDPIVPRGPRAKVAVSMARTEISRFNEDFKRISNVPTLDPQIQQDIQTLKQKVAQIESDLPSNDVYNLIVKTRVYRQIKASNEFSRVSAYADDYLKKGEKNYQNITPKRESASSFFQPRVNPSSTLTVNSKPKALIDEVNNLKKRLKKVPKSTAPIAKASENFFRNILMRKDEQI